jgi:hypothetical protein
MQGKNREGENMTKRAGLWIDHRKAMVVIISEEGEEMQTIESGLEKRVRFKSKGLDEAGSTEDVRERRYQKRENEYFDKVVAAVRSADSLHIFGPGEAKHELVRRLERAGLKQCVAEVVTVDKLTDRQLAAKVREHTRK